MASFMEVAKSMDQIMSLKVISRLAAGKKAFLKMIISNTKASSIKTLSTEKEGLSLLMGLAMKASFLMESFRDWEYWLWKMENTTEVSLSKGSSMEAVK